MKQHVIGNLPKGLLFVVSAPAGTGKTTLVRRLTKEFPSVIESISFTTRSTRTGEIDGKDYHFISKEEFDKRIKKDDFLEYAEVFGHYYGTSRSFVEEKLSSGKHVILVIDTQGALHIQKKLEAVLIFLHPPSPEEQRTRLHKRSTETPESIEKRLAWAKHELKAGEKYDYQIINDDLDVAYEILKSILIAEEHKTCHFRPFSTKRG